MNDSFALEMPASYESEKAILSSMLIGGYEVIDEVSQWLRAESFYVPAHRTLFETITKLRDKLQVVEMASLTSALHDRNLLAEVGGPAAVFDVFNYMPTAANVMQYVRTVAGKEYRRNVIIAGGELARDGYDQDGVSDEGLKESVETKLFSLATDELEHKGVVTAAEVVKECFAEIEVARANRGSVSGIPTGIPKLDRMIFGLQKELIVIAARPSCGKTALGMQIALRAAYEDRKPTLVFSLEMRSSDIMKRMLSGMTGVDSQKMRNGFLKDSELTQLTAIGTEIYNSPLYFDETPGLSISSLRSRSRRASVKYGIELIVIDYMQLITSQSRRALENRYIEIAEISSGLKNLQRELKIPVLALAQLNRESERGGKPKLAHLRESGSIEQDADQVWALSRVRKEGDPPADPDEGDILLQILKQRNGPTGEILLLFHPSTTRFSGRDQDGVLYSQNPEERQQDRN